MLNVFSVAVGKGEAADCPLRVLAVIETKFPAIDRKSVLRHFRYRAASVIQAMFKTGTVFVALMLGAGASFAQTEDKPTALGAAGDWSAFTYATDTSKVCYVYSQPKKMAANKKGVNRGPVYFMITHAPGNKVKAQPSTFIGYAFKEASVVKLTIEGAEFNLFPSENGAWTDKVETERAILKAMKTGKTMTVSGVSAKGTETTDTYSLNGISAAMGTIDEACK
jgi:invasion protein IalB